MEQVRLEIREVAQALEGRLMPLAETIAGRIVDEVEELPAIDDGQLQEVLEELARAALRTELLFLRRGQQPSTCPPETEEGVRHAAAARIPEVAVLRTQRIGHAVVWDAYVDEVERLVIDPGPRRSVLDAGSRFFFEYADRLARFVNAAYEREWARGQNRAEIRRLRLVIDVLEGRGRDLADLGYDLTLHHIGAIADGENAEHYLRILARALDRRLLLVGAASSAVWAWLAGAEAPDRAAWRAIARSDAPGTAVALGEPGAGVDGFRRTHLQAQAAHRVAVRRSRAVTRYADVALEALALHDERAAADFVRLELHALGDGDRAQTLRETLRAYFDCGQNAAATGAALRIHEQTVAHRLRAIEQSIGCPVNARRAELETALRIEALLRPPLER